LNYLEFKFAAAEVFEKSVRTLDYGQELFILIYQAKSFEMLSSATGIFGLDLPKATFAGKQKQALAF